MMISYFQDIGVAEEKISGTLLIMTVHRGTGCIDSDGEIATGFRSLYIKAFADIATGNYDIQNYVNGSQFHLVMAALIHALGEVTPETYGKLIAVESKRDVFLQSLAKGAENVTPRIIRPNESGDFTRFVDLVTQKEGNPKPTYIEVKSYQGQKGANGNLNELADSVIKKAFSTWTFKTKGSEQKPHKQYLLDRIMATDNELIQRADLRDQVHQASEIHWFFQKFKLKTRSGLTDKQMDVIRNQLAQNASGDNKKISASLGYKTYAA
ncbi:MAG: hypothetical protein CSH36_09365, partial [Thalassolituus sp.]